MILVTGCPRSGTVYYASWLRSLGYDFKHEGVGETGCVSWMFAVDDDAYPYKHETRRSDHEFDEIVHLVRNPIDCIASLITMGPKAWMFIDRHVGIDDRWGHIGRAASAWLRWNQLCEEQADTRIRIEDVPYDPAILSNTRPHPPVDWDALAYLPFADELRMAARRYGYA